MRKTVIPIVAVLVLGVATAVMARGGHRGLADGARTGETSLLEQVLGDLVEDETITQDQSDAITTALENKRTQAREARQATRDQIDEFWEDDVLTSDEISQLPSADRITAPDGPFAEALEDGQITREEFEEIRSDHGRDRWGKGHRIHAAKKATETPSEAV